MSHWSRPARAYSSVKTRMLQDAATRADAGPSRSPHENFYPARAEPAKQLVTFKWLTKKHGKKVRIRQGLDSPAAHRAAAICLPHTCQGLKGAKRAATSAVSVAPQVSEAQATLVTCTLHCV